MFPALLAAAAGLVLCWYCTGHHAPVIQADIQSRTQAALQKAQFSIASLSVDGRDVLITGVRPEARTQVYDTAAAVWGVRDVRIEESAAVPLSAAASVSEVQNKLNDIVRLRNIEFLSGSAELTAEGTATVEQVAAALSTAPALTIAISGHTDASGNAEANQRLSEARAAAVKTYLVSRGIAASRMTAAGFGQTRPVADNATPEGKSQNRRIEFSVTGGASERLPQPK